MDSSIVSTYILVFFSSAILSFGYSRALLWARDAYVWWRTWMEVVIGDGLVVGTIAILIAIVGFPAGWLEWFVMTVGAYVAWGGPIIIWQTTEDSDRERTRLQARMDELNRAARKPRRSVDDGE